MRFYHAKIDSENLDAGEEYSKLRNVIVIFITTYDPLGRDRMVYTIKPLLHYMEESTNENAQSEGLKALHKMVTAVKCDGEVGYTYMKSFERDQQIEAKGREEGRAEGRNRTLVEQVCKKLRKGQDAERIADDLEVALSEIQSICNAALPYAPEYDIESVYRAWH